MYTSSSTIQSNPFSIEQKMFSEWPGWLPSRRVFFCNWLKTTLYRTRERKSGDFIVSCVIAVVIITAKPIEKEGNCKS